MPDKSHEQVHQELPGFDPSQDVVLDPRSLRGLAHPIRIRLRAELAEHGPATATQLAMRIGESSGATSYHLRQLAAFGFVVDDPTRSRGRERYWRVAHRSTWFDMPHEASSERAVGAEYLRAVAHLYAERIVRFADSIESAPDVLGQEWADEATMSDWMLDLDVEEAAELRRRFHELCLPYRQSGDRAEAGKRRVIVQFQVLPTPAAAPDRTS